MSLLVFHKKFQSGFFEWENVFENYVPFKAGVEQTDRGIEGYLYIFLAMS